MNLFKELVITAPVSARLQFGHNANIIVTAVDTSVRKVKGLPIKANTFITLSQVDPETRKVVAQNEFNYWNLDPTTEFCLTNFVEQMTSLASIVDAMGLDISAFETGLLKILGGKEIEEVIKTKDGAKLMQDALQDTFYELVKDTIGANCPLLKCKLTVNKKGYLEIGKVQGWILSMDNEESLPDIDAREIKMRAEALSASSTAKQVKPDELGAAKAPGATIAAAPEKAVVKGGGFSGL